MRTLHARLFATPHWFAQSLLIGLLLYLPKLPLALLDLTPEDPPDLIARVHAAPIDNLILKPILFAPLFETGVMALLLALLRRLLPRPDLPFILAVAVLAIADHGRQPDLILKTALTFAALAWLMLLAHRRQGAAVAYWATTTIHAAHNATISLLAAAALYTA